MSISKEECRKQFKAAYENRYTWGTEFKGYKGKCSWSNGEINLNGLFLLDRNMKANVQDIDDETVSKSIESQLWEVGIHRIRRPFEKTHGENIFIAGDHNQTGLEVIVEGKNKGDKYRIKDNIVTMVYRHIHGRLITILTEKVIHTGNGYLSKNYSSQYLDPISNNPIKGKTHYSDIFLPLYEGGPWVLTSRSIDSEGFEGLPMSKEVFKFSDLDEDS